MAGTVREVEVFPIRMRELDVLRVEDVTPGMRRVTVGGPSMDQHVRDGIVIPAVRTSGFDDDIKLLPADPVTGTLPFEEPTNSADGTVDWPAGSFQYSRTYTVRRFDRDAREMDIDFVVHAGGLAAEWANRVGPGEKILIAGPKHSSSLPVGVDWMLVAGDETALPAIAHCLEKLPSDLPATVVIEVAEPAHRQELLSDADVDITWLYRSDNGGESRLAQTVQDAQWRRGQPYLWVAGESTTVKPLRRWAKHDTNLDKRFVEIAGYWRRRDIAADGDRAADVASAGESLHELSELLPPLVIRTAVTLGVFSAVDGGADSVEEISAHCNSHPGATAKLLRHLVLMGLLTVDAGRFSATEKGAILGDDDGPVAQALNFDSIQTRLDMAFMGLVDSVRTGSPAAGHGFADKASEPGFTAGFHEESAFEALYRSPALPTAVDLADVDSVAVYGEGAGVYADTLARLLPRLEIYLVGLPALGDRNFSDIVESRRGRVTRIDSSEFTPLAQPVDLAVAVGVVDTMPDPDAILLIATLARSARRVVLVTDLLDPSTTDDHVTEDDLRRLCLYGSGLRTETELTALVREAGAREPRFGALGWGSTVVEYTTV